MEAIGKKRWAIAEGYIPTWSNGPAPEMTSHEALCILNASDQDADLTLTLFFTDREPVEAEKFQVKAKRSYHLRLNGVPGLKTGVEYSAVLESSVPVVVQHTRLDSRQEANALMTTIAFSQ